MVYYLQECQSRMAHNSLGLIWRFLKAVVMEQGTWEPTESDTLQGALISPIFANPYLHYALDLWFEIAVLTAGVVPVLAHPGPDGQQLCGGARVGRDWVAGH